MAERNKREGGIWSKREEKNSRRTAENSRERGTKKTEGGHVGKGFLSAD